MSIQGFSEIPPKSLVSEPNLILFSEEIDLSRAKKSFPKEILGATLLHGSDFLSNKTIKDGDIAPDSSGTICLHGQMERFEQIEKKRTIK